jgi:mRNA interferase RelE/StbE
MVWQVEFLPVAEKELAKLDRPVAQLILAFLDQRVRTAKDPRALGQALVSKDLSPFWKYSVGDYRLICAIHDRRVVVTVVRVAHRSGVHGTK